VRSSLPTAVEAAERTEAWLRERQVSAGGEVLIITGRGSHSEGGVAVVRPAVERRLARLRRLGVVSSVAEYNPGAFVVVLAPLREMLAAQRRRKDPPAKPADAGVLITLEPATRSVLRELALCTLEQLGAAHTEEIIADEMTRQFSRLVLAVGEGSDRESRLRAAARAALEDISNF